MGNIWPGELYNKRYSFFEDIPAVFETDVILKRGTGSGERARGRNRKLKNREKRKELEIINEVTDMASIQVRFCS